MFNKIFESRLQNNSFKNKDLRGNTSIESTNYGLVDVLILYSSNLSIKDCQSNMQKELARKGKRIVCFIPINDFENFVSANNFNLLKDVEEQFVIKAFVYNLMHFGNESYTSVFSTI
jgi:hypothetical protein